jgi:hypothetical protein
VSEDEDALGWRVHLAARSPGRTAGALLMIGVGALAAGVGSRSAGAGLLALVLLLSSVSDYLLPLHYRLSESGIEAKGLIYRRRMRWPEVRRVLRERTGVKLSPLPGRSRLEAYRGIYLWFDGNEADVMAAIARYRGAETDDGNAGQSG